MLKPSTCIYSKKDKDPSQPICLWKSSKCHFQFKVMTFLLHSSDLLEFLHKSINLVENIKTLYKEQFQRRLTLTFHFDLSGPHPCTHARVISQKHPTIVQHKSCYLETMKPVSVSCWIKSFSFYILNTNWNLQKTGRLLKAAFSLEVCVNLPGSGWLCRPRQPPPPTSTLPNSPAIVDGHPFKGTLFKATSRAPPQATGHPFTLLWAPLGAHPAITITISLVPCLAPPSNQEAQRDQEFQSAPEKNFCKFPGSCD